MALGSCYIVIKYLMFAFNFLFWLLGCAILGVGIWLRVDPSLETYVNHGEDFSFLYTLAYVLMTIGIVIMIIGFLGCCGAIRESSCMLGTFFILLFIIFAILLAAGIWTVVEKDTMRKEIGDWLQEAIDNYKTDDGNRKFIDGIQKSFDCCGSRTGATDYKDTPQLATTCEPEHYADPCEKAFFNWMASNLIIVAGIAIAVAIVLIIGMIFSMVLCCAVRQQV